MRVCVEEAVEEQLVEHDCGELGRDLDGVDAGGSQRIDVVDLDRRDILRGQHPTGGPFPHELGDPHARITREIAGEPLAVGSLVQVVDLLQAGGGELLEKGGHVYAVVDQSDPAEPLGDAAKRREVDVDDLVDARSLHLQHDVA